VLTVYTFGDSILDCGSYNNQGITPGQLLVRNHDRLFPEFRGRDLSSRGPARLEERACDGSTVSNLPAQTHGLEVDHPSVALLTVGGNDFLQAIHYLGRFDADRFAHQLDAFLTSLPIRPVCIGNVYDPVFGEDDPTFLPGDPKELRAEFSRLNRTIAEVAARHGQLVDIHAHFLEGDPSWFTCTIEPSLQGASEIRRCFLPLVLKQV
jgi:hypothetical protein